ncbi:MAG: U32 family peptidase [Muribaculaceae bacterium]|nr:U32 family peptidase [Muribaculaceae bacterium]
MKKIELLAPAGNYRAFIGALNAGADAVYLGGNQFSARAYADNFSEEEICMALRYAHIFGKKIYLTVNTLMKEKEFPLLDAYIAPLYEAGLDGVIVQDLGVFRYIRQHFPNMALHVSTQMMITGTLGALFLKKEGACRIVPARELSLTEIRSIKEKTGLELECFIHGAMCYCYSGGCLFSSILGGRSGNRGRCAQPCRLPYTIADEDGRTALGEAYPLSLKDLCTIEEIPKLIGAGIDSFKIEGRMKKPEYVAGVTALYRKYIDRYYENGEDAYHVEKPDMDRLRKLYIRSEVQNGYFWRTNGKEMITLQKPGYAGSDENLIKEIEAQYLQEEKKHPAAIKGSFCVGKPAMLQIEGQINGKEVIQVVYGEDVQPAINRPMAKEAFLKQLRKTGNSHVRIVSEDVHVEEGVFMPIVQLNELRRQALDAFEDQIITAQGFSLRRGREKLQEKADSASRSALGTADNSPRLHILVRNRRQLQIVSQYPWDRLYIDSDYYIQDVDWISQYLDRIKGASVYLALPHIMREKDSPYFEALSAMLHEQITGFLVRNIESAAWVLSLSEKSGKSKAYAMTTDAGVYCWNKEAVSFWSAYTKESYLPWELNKREEKDLLKESGQHLSMIVYGTIPMMVTANCVKKTADLCRQNHKECPMYLIDRYQIRFPVLCNCRHCYNVIYNSIPYSLHQKRNEIWESGLFAVRLDFLWETDEQIHGILDYYTGKADRFPLADYTTGHYKRGVE